MKSKVIKILALLVGLGIIAAAGLGLYFSFTSGPSDGKFQFGVEYHMTEIRKSDKFKGATLDTNSYFKINGDQKTGVLYLVGLEATNESIPFVVTKYDESKNKTIIHLDYIIYNGDDTYIQKLQAISTNNRIEIKSVESHGIQDIIQQNPSEIDQLEYEVTIMVFSKESA